MTKIAIRVHLAFLETGSDTKAIYFVASYPGVREGEGTPGYEAIYFADSAM